MVSPFHSPPSTPSSPGVRPQASEPEEVPISFDQPPEGSHLPCYNKVTPGSESAVGLQMPGRGGHVWAEVGAGRQPSGNVSSLQGAPELRLALSLAACLLPCPCIPQQKGSVGGGEHCWSMVEGGVGTQD